MKTAYVAGPYRAGTGLAIEQNIQAARQVRDMTTADLLDRGERVVVSVIVGRMTQ